MKSLGIVGIGVFAAMCGLGCANSSKVAAPTPGDTTPTASVEASTASTQSDFEVTVGVPVPDLDAAVAWYAKLLGRDLERLDPIEGMVELRVASGMWLQLFCEGQWPPLNRCRIGGCARNSQLATFESVLAQANCMPFADTCTEES